MAELNQGWPQQFRLYFADQNGKPLTNGYLKTYLASDHSQLVQTYTYPGSGVLNPTTVRLDNYGCCKMGLDAGTVYYIELYDKWNALVGTYDNVTTGGGVGGDPSPDAYREIKYVSKYTSYEEVTQALNDGKLPVLLADGETWVYAQVMNTLPVPNENATNIIHQYSYVFAHGPTSVIEEEINSNEIISSVSGGVYELTRNDSWIRHDQFLATYDLAVGLYNQISNDLESYKVQVANILNTKQDKLIAGNNITINGNTISAVIPSRVQSDWTENNPASPAYIRNKPELSEAYFHAICGNTGYTGSNLNAYLNEVESEGEDIYLNSGVLTFNKGYYHVDVDVKITGATVDVNDYTVVINGFGYSKLSQTYDNTYSHNEIIHFAFDMIVEEDEYEMPLTITHSIPGAKAYIESIHAFDVLAMTVNGLTIPIDAELSLESENPVQNKVITGALNTKANSSDLATVATTGSYTDLINTPTIPAAPVQSDWDEADTTALDYIKNKPNLSIYAESADLATVATTGSYYDLSDRPVIPNPQIQSDWTEADNTKKSYIKNKPTFATVAFTGSYNDLTDVPPGQIVDFTTDAEVNSIIADFV